MHNEHEQLREKLADYSTGELHGIEWLTVRAHLSDCDSCRAELAQPVLWNRASPARILPPHGPSPAPADRIEARPGSDRPKRAAAPVWPVWCGSVAVAGLVGYGITYALHLM